jgi:hypothetical protein
MMEVNGLHIGHVCSRVSRIPGVSERHARTLAVKGI